MGCSDRCLVDGLAGDLAASQEEADGDDLID